MKKLNHIQLFETFQDSEMGKVYATCFQGDSYACVGILNEEQRKKLQDAIDEVYSEDIQWARLDSVDVTEMGYVLNDVNGDFKAMPKSTNTDDYAYYIKKDGKMPENRTINYEAVNDEDRLFELVEGALLSIDHHGYPELLSVEEFIRTYITGGF